MEHRRLRSVLEQLAPAPVGALEEGGQLGDARAGGVADAL